MLICGTSTTADLLEAVNEVEGAVTTKNGVKSLATAPTNGKTVTVGGFYAGSTVGGGAFVWDAARDKADHNGGTVIAPEAAAAWDGTPADILTLLDWTGAGAGCWVRESSDLVNLFMFGAVTGDSTQNADVIERVYLQGNSYQGFEVSTPEGGFGVHRQINIPSAYIRSTFSGYWYAMDGFTGDYLVNVESGGQAGGYTPQFYYPSFIANLWIKCRFLTRGVRTHNVDHLDYHTARVENSWGTAFTFDRLRESTVFMPQAINCAHREAFSDAEVARKWEAGVTDTKGDIVLREPDAYDAGLTYETGEVVLYGDENWISAGNGNVGNTPSVGSAYWRKVPKQHYKCLISNNSQDPLVQNTNQTNTADYYWQKVYQDEALFNVVDEVTGVADRQNQVTFYSPICRDSDNKCLFRIDNNRNFSSNTHINIYSGHIHQIGVAALGEYPEITGQSDIRCLELGRVINCNIHGTNLFTADRPNAIAVLVGDMGSKTASSIRLQAAVAIDGDNSTGLVVMPSVQGSDKNIIEPAYIKNNDNNYMKFVDSKRFTRREYDNEAIINIPAGRVTVPYGQQIIGAADYPEVRYTGFRKFGDNNDRVRVESTAAGTSRVGFGDGSNTPDAYLERKGSNRLGTGAGDTWQIDATFDAPFRMGGVYVWTDGNDVRVKATAPSSATDGQLWITAT